MPFTWLPSLARYRDDETGRFVARDTILGYVSDSVRAAITAPPVADEGVISAGSSTLSSLVSMGLLSPGDWEDLMREEIKREYIRQYLLGIGGREQMTAANWGSIGGMLAEQYRFLGGFTEAIAAGELSEAQIQARAAMYMNSAREGYERANRLSQIKAGMTEMFWELFPPAEHCIGCEEFNAMGWVLIADDPYEGCFPGSACTPCLTGCVCGILYR